MYIPIKRVTAILVMVSLSLTYFMACGVKEENESASIDLSEESVGYISAASTEDEGSKYQSGCSSETEKVTASEESFDNVSSNENSTVTDSSVSDTTITPDNSEEISMENSRENSIENSIENSEENNSSNITESSELVKEESSAASNDSSAAFSEDSSEESVYVPKDPSDPLTPIPQALYADPIDSHFNSSVFVGYSIMMHFGRYIGQWRTEIDSSIMGNAVNVSAVGISFYKNNTQTPSTPGNSLPLFRGVAYNFEDLPAATGSNTIYIGLTCYSEMKVYSSPKGAADEVISGVEKIKAKNPGVTVVLLSGTYNTGTFEQLGVKYSTRLSNANIRKFNNYVLDYCNQNGVDFVDVSTPLTNGYGYMPIEYSSDNDYHIAKDAFLIWIDVLRDYARQKEAGTWQNLTVMPELGM